MRLSTETLGVLPPDVIRPSYDRAKQAAGIVHFGIGAFHRAHQAVYTDEAMNAGDRNWLIQGVSLRSPAVADQLNPQSGLYTVATRSSAGDSYRLIGAVAGVLVGAQPPAGIIAAVAAPETRIISTTITEKGYQRRADGDLDLAAPGIAADLRDGNTPQTLYGYLYNAHKQRRAGGLPGLTLLCCDNLAANGAQIQRLFEQFLEARDPAMAHWFRQECACPSTMVDRIVPAIGEDDRDRIAKAIGLRDEAAVITEPFSQWVIEDRFAGPRPRWEAGGATFVGDVRSYETAKLRMLNGAHSALAYLGLFRGYDFVHQAIADPVLRAMIERLMLDEAASSLHAAPGQDLAAYARSLIARFGNSALPHSLKQIAMDGSQKIPQRWLATLRHHQTMGRSCPVLMTALGAWIAYVRGDRFTVEDPRAEELAALWRQSGPDGIVSALFGTSGLFADHWSASADEIAFVREQLCALIAGVG